VVLNRRPGSNSPTFRRNIPPPSSGWKIWDRQASSSSDVFLRRPGKCEIVPVRSIADKTRCIDLGSRWGVSTCLPPPQQYVPWIPCPVRQPSAFWAPTYVFRAQVFVCAYKTHFLKGMCVHPIMLCQIEYVRGQAGTRELTFEFVAFVVPTAITTTKTVVSGVTPHILVFLEGSLRTPR
jgi:hypothetical protein